MSEGRQFHLVSNSEAMLHPTPTGFEAWGESQFKEDRSGERPQSYVDFKARLTFSPVLK